jgi:hypothetical protein
MMQAYPQTYTRADLIAAACKLSAAAFSERAGIIPDPWQRRLLLSDANRILINCSRQSGKSTTIATLALHTALYTPKSLVLMLSPSQRQSGELFKKMLGVYRGTGRPVPAESETALSLTLSNRSRIVSLPGKEGVIRGYSGVRLLLIDEASRVPDDLYMSVRPMLAVSHGRLIAASTPFGTRGWWYEAWRSKEDWERYEVPASECPRISAAFLAEERRTMGDWWFQQEYMAMFLDSQSSAFRQADIDAALATDYAPWNLDALPETLPDAEDGETWDLRPFMSV